MWQKIKSAAKWLGKQIANGFRWMGIKLGLVTAIPLPAAAETTSFRHYLNLPSALSNQVSSFLNHKELNSLNIARGRSAAAAASVAAAVVPSSRTLDQVFMYRQFREAPMTAKLLKAVEYADYEQAKQMTTHDTSLMFKPVNFIYRDGSSECISPLKYAFKVYDTYMWKLFYERIKDNPEYRQAFLKQAMEQTTHINLEPLFTAYQEYENQRLCWLRDEITDQGVNAAWYKLGKVQKAILPVHMLKEFSREENTWSTSSAFDVNAVPAPKNCRLYDYITGVWKTLSSTLSDLGWGVSFSLIRGERPAPLTRLRAAEVWRFIAEASRQCRVDAATFCRLFEVRTEDLAKQLSLMSQNSLENQDSKNQSLSSSSATQVAP